MLKKIEGGSESFAALERTEQVAALMEFIRLLKTGRSSGCDLKAFGASGQAGILTLNANLSKSRDITSLCIIDQSPTGLIERRSPNLLEL